MIGGIMAKVIMNHGTGGEIMQEFLAKHVTSHFPKMKSEVPLSSFDDSVDYHVAAGRNSHILLYISIYLNTSDKVNIPG